HGLLSAGEGVSIVVGLPKGVVVEPGFAQKFWEFLRDNGMLFLPLVVLLGFYRLWRKRGRDSEEFTVVPEYEAPLGLSPSEAGTIVDEQADNKDITAEIINLAVKGFVKINQTEEKTFGVFKTTDYRLELLKKADGSLNALQTRLLEALFGQKNEVKLSDLKNEFYQELAELKELAYKSVVEKGFFLKDPSKTRLYFGLVALMFFIFGIILTVVSQNPYWFVSMAINAIIAFIFSRYMPAKTSLGAKTKARVLGLKLYLSVAEKDRLNFHNAPEKKPEIFEKLLPFAMALGVEKAWAKQFEGIYINPPSWYGGNNTVFNSLVLTSALGDFSKSANAAFVPASSSGSGSSGFSGGGFGGGGGGSW
ncbi:MAG: DUF2207 domain-containing protein, partial [Candidatus Doudnabacteria bacterium]|nr:DUF2207 domain-containing protein [Candidatus Doudnabacteria bacterium]